jgi:hypothetical protein
MRGATDCAKRLKSLFNSLRSRLGKVAHPPATDPITQLILGVLTRDVPEAKASEGLERLRGMVVDYNELRVIPPIELAQVLGDFPDSRLKCEDISRALNAIFAQEHTISLDRLTSLPKRDVLAILDELDGLEPYTRARIRLLGLHLHAIPLDEAMWAAARAQGIVDPKCGLAEAQAFLERHVADEDALEFVALLRKHAWAECGAAVRKHEVERILSVPPDRTSRNMLQQVSAAALGPDEPELDEEELELEDADEPPAAKPRKPVVSKPPAGKPAPRPRPAAAAKPPARRPAPAKAAPPNGRATPRKPEKAVKPPRADRASRKRAPGKAPRKASAG